MVEGDATTEDEGGGLFPQSVGERLRAARTAAQLDLNDVATKTRIPIRHLEAIERSDYASLPSATYAIGFARSFARAVDADEAAIARDLRAELGRAPADDADFTPYEPVDPARLPSRLLAWSTAIIAILLVGGYLILRTEIFGQSAPPPVEAPTATTQPTTPVAATPAPAAVPTTGTVVLTATAPVWLRVYDKADKVLLQKEMAVGETFTVPADADTPMVRTGRADALKVTIDGREVPPLGPPEKTVRNVVLTAAALAARPVPTAAIPSAPPLQAPAQAPTAGAPVTAPADNGAGPAQ